VLTFVGFHRGNFTQIERSVNGDDCKDDTSVNDVPYFPDVCSVNYVVTRDTIDMLEVNLTVSEPKKAEGTRQPLAFFRQADQDIAHIECTTDTNKGTSHLLVTMRDERLLHLRAWWATPGALMIKKDIGWDDHLPEEI